MDQEYQAKLHHRLTSFEKNHKQWEWSDLIKWLSSLKIVCEKYNSKISEDILLLTSKRLSQCLNPSLPQGIHLETLGIYNVILNSCDSRDIFLLSPGLFQHFQYCSGENKPIFLAMIQSHFLNKSPLSLLNTGIVTCLMSGAGDKQETLAKVTDILDSFENKQALHFSVWKIILKSKDFRNVGLIYMQKRTCRDYCEELIVATLLEAVDDPKVTNKRLALDIIKTYFPIKSNDSTTIDLMHGVFKLYKGKDYSVIRRLWEWAYPDEAIEKQRELIREISQKAIGLIFKENHVYLEVQKERIKEIGSDCLKIVDELCESEEIGEGFFGMICLDFVRHVVNDQIFEADKEKFYKIIERYKKDIWEQFERYFSSEFEDEKFAVDILWFIERFLGIEDKECVGIAMKIAEGLHRVQDFSVFLKFLVLFIEKSPFSSSVSVKLKKSRKKMSKLLELGKEEELLSYVYVLSRFMKNHPEINTILTYLKILLSSNLVLTLKILELFEEKSLTEGDFQNIWSHLNIGDENLMDILLNLYDSFQEQWCAGLMNLLIAKERESFIKVFVSFYQHALVADPEKLFNIMSSGNIVIKMLECLSDENPTIRHAAREWLNLSIKVPSSILDPLLKILLHSSTIRRKEGDKLIYVKNFDSSPILTIFGQLNLLFLQSQILIFNSISCEPSAAAKLLASEHLVTTENYYWILIQVCFLYINSDTDFYKNEYTKVQASSCEVLRILASKLPRSYYEEILDRVGLSVNKNLGKNLEYSLIPVVYSVIKLGFSFFYPSKLADSAVLGVLSKDITIRQHWAKIFSIALGNLPVNEVKDSCVGYLSFLFISLYNLIKEYDDPVVIETLHSLIRICLQQNSDQKLQNLVFANMETLFIVIINAKKNEEVSRILYQITPKFLNEVVVVLMDFWKKHYESSGVDKLIPKLGIAANDLIKNILALQSCKKMNEIALGNLVLMCLEKTYNTIKSEDIWKTVLKICKLLFDSKWDEVIVDVIRILHFVYTICPPKGGNIKLLQKLFKSLLEKCKINFLRWEKQKPSSFVKVSGETILEVVLNELIFSISIFKLIWKDKQKSLNRAVYHLAKTALDDLDKIEKNGEVVLKFLSSMILTFPALFENVKSTLTETIKSSLFKYISIYPKSIDYWFEIIKCFPSSTVIKTLKIYDILVIKSSEKRKQQEKTLTVICFILMSKERDSFTESTYYILKRIKQGLEEEMTDSLFSIICVLLRILSLKLSGFDKIWDGISFIFIPLMIKVFESSKYYQKYEVLKIIDTFLITFPGFSTDLWIFLYDSADLWSDPEAKNSDFKPAVGKCLDSFKVRPKHGQLHEDLNGIQRKKIIFSEIELVSNEDFDKNCKTLINYSMLYTAVPLDIDYKSVEDVLVKELTKFYYIINN